MQFCTVQYVGYSETTKEVMIYGTLWGQWSQRK